MPCCVFVRKCRKLNILPFSAMELFYVCEDDGTFPKIADHGDEFYYIPSREMVVFYRARDLYQWHEVRMINGCIYKFDRCDDINWLNNLRTKMLESTKVERIIELPQIVGALSCTIPRELAAIVCNYYVAVHPGFKHPLPTITARDIISKYNKCSVDARSIDVSNMKLINTVDLHEYYDGILVNGRQVSYTYTIYYDLSCIRPYNWETYHGTIRNDWGIWEPVGDWTGLVHSIYAFILTERRAELLRGNPAFLI